MSFKKGHVYMGGMLGKTHSLATRQKIKESHKGKKLSPEHIKNMLISKKESYLKRHGIKEYEQGLWKSFCRYKYNAKERNHEFDLTFEQFKVFYQKMCCYCGNEIATIGLDRVDNEKGYTLENLVACCSVCNYMKRGLPKNIFLEQCAKIIATCKIC